MERASSVLWNQLRGIVVTTLLGVGAACGGSDEFSQNFAQEIMTDCTQTLTCTPGVPLAACVTKTGTMLDSATSAQQQKFLDNVTRCEAMLGCGYSQCQVSDPMAGYAGAHQGQIAYDCQQTATCRALVGQAATDFMTSCSNELATTLNSGLQAQATFEAMLTRCGAASYVGCDWVNCRNGIAPGASATPTTPTTPTTP
jgi:hypothetical protein